MQYLQAIIIGALIVVAAWGGFLFIGYIVVNRNGFTLKGGK
jgi:hypothetical protein